jgi:DNA-binding Lrp family transcriptional regulator
MTDVAAKDELAKSLSRLGVRIGPSLGKYDLYGAIHAKKLNDLAQIVQKIDIKPYVKKLELLIFSDLWENPWHPENLLVNPNEQQEDEMLPRPRNKYEPVTLDDTDILIIKSLLNDSRVAFREIAEKVKISTAKVVDRYRLFREKNVINLSSISVDPIKLGYQAIADSYIKVANRENLPEVETELLKIPNLTFCAKFVGGTYDMRAATLVANFKDFFRLKKRIDQIKNIEKTDLYLFGDMRPWPSAKHNEFLE